MTGYVEGRRWVLEIPAPGDWKPKVSKRKPMPAKGWPLKPEPLWLSMNDHRDRMINYRIERRWRAAATNAARTALWDDARRRPLPVGEVTRAHVHALVRFAVPERGNGRDSSNWHPTVKPCLDALTKGTKKYPGYGFMPDDEPLKHLHCEDCPHVRKSPDLLDTRPPFGPVGLLVVTLTELLEDAS